MGKLNVGPDFPASVGGRSDPGEIMNLFMQHFKMRSPLGAASESTDAGLVGLREEFC